MDKKVLGVNIVGATSLRIKEEERDPNLYYYDIRHSDEDFGEPAEIKEFVLVNHFGTLITEEPLDLGEEGFYILTEEDAEAILSVI